MRLDAVELIIEDILYLRTNYDDETWLYIVISLELYIVIFSYIMITHIKYNRMKYIQIKTSSWENFICFGIIFF